MVDFLWMLLNAWESFGGIILFIYICQCSDFSFFFFTYSFWIFCTFKPSSFALAQIVSLGSFRTAGQFLARAVRSPDKDYSTGDCWTIAGPWLLSVSVSFSLSFLGGPWVHSFTPGYSALNHLQISRAGVLKSSIVHFGEMFLSELGSQIAKKKNKQNKTKPHRNILYSEAMCTQFFSLQVCWF